MKSTPALAIVASSLLLALSTASDDTTTNATASTGNRTLLINATPGNVCLMANDVDFIGGDLTSTRGGYDTCCDQCTRNFACVGWSWTNYQGGTCWLKSNVNNAKVYPGAKGSIIVMDPTETTYTGFSNCDMPGNDVYNTRAANIQSCVSTCLGLWKCEAITWTNYEGGTCWYKSAMSQCNNYPGAVSIRIFQF